jgi:hypothetical protein
VSVDVSYFRRIFGNFTVTHNQNLTAANFDQFNVIAPVDSRLGDRSGQTVTGFFDVNNASVKIPPSNVTVLTQDLPGSPTQIQHWNGVDVSVNARLQNGILLQGGISTGRNSANNCAVAQVFPDILTTAGPGGLATQPGAIATTTGLQDCAVTTPFLTQGKLIAVYTVPKVAVQIAATFQSLPGNELQSVFTLTNANVPQNSTLGRNLNAAGAQRPLDLLPADTSLLAERLNQLDLRFAKILRYGKTRTNVSVDIFNSLNSDTITTYSTLYETLWRPTNLLQARFIKFSAQFDF